MRKVCSMYVGSMFVMFKLVMLAHFILLVTNSLAMSEFCRAELDTAGTTERLNSCFRMKMVYQNK